MAALTEGRNTPQALGDIRTGPVAAAALIFEGALVMRNAAGDLVPASTATGLMGVGRAEERADNSAGAAGDQNLAYRPGVFRFANSAGGDAIGQADIGKVVYAVDDQTVALTDGTGTRSKAGFVDAIDAQGVWVRFDEALTRLA
ncbi:hypothetical protein DDZ14_16140 [Maritimibacter sp. 55A14]|uniref:hypothetical protein n=1 Tax=Maritimibacter sp. 55A14 TaxID=2174844 RepID=UPI000D61556C|nr:hypothetical protein [Maritimibacter sp. 55A14]PWE29971.1 hypothetical protein DDZ14_16140 [Maritimibacter sp. 55A14]